MKKIAIWSVTGEDNTDLSFNLAKTLSKTASVFICELADLGIPRLAFRANISERLKNSESAILTYAKNKNMDLENFINIDKKLLILPASIYESPDRPISTRTDPEVIKEFIEYIEQYCESHDIDYLIYEIQGQMNLPMCFFSIQNKDLVIIPARHSEGIVYITNVIERLTDMYSFKPSNFLLWAGEDYKYLSKYIKNNEGIKEVKTVKPGMDNIIKCIKENE